MVSSSFWLELAARNNLHCGQWHTSSRDCREMGAAAVFGGGTPLSMRGKPGLPVG